MKRKVLQHESNTLCEMFVGWQLLEDYNVFTELQGGTLVLNILSNTCEFSGKQIKPLFMLSILRNWLEQDLQRDKLSLSLLTEATMVVDFKTTIVLPPAGSVLCKIQCESRIRLSDKLYTAHRVTTHSWSLKGIKNKHKILTNLKTSTA